MAAILQLFPSIAFNEANVGPRPVRSVAIDRVGMAAVFDYGPVQPAICDETTARKLFGVDATVGSAHMQAVIDQGVGDILISRVLPAARKASLEVTLTGTGSGAGSVLVKHQTGAGAITTLATVTIDDGMVASALATAIVNALAAETSPINVTLGSGNAGTTGKLVVKADVAGVAGNDEKIRFEIVTTTGFTADPAGVLTAQTALAGGVDAAKPATVTLEASDTTPLLELTAMAYGTASNTALRAVVSASYTPNRFNLVIEDTNRGLKETYNDIDLTDVYDEDKLSVLKSSLLVAQGKVLASSDICDPGTFTFSGGSNGDATLVTEDFTTAIDDMATIQCTIIICPGLKPNGVDQEAINAVLVAQAENGDREMGELIGLRIAVLPAPRGTVQAELVGLRTSGYVPDSQRAVMVVGWATSARVAKFKRFGIDPSAVYAGILMTTPKHVSPAAATSARAARGITEVDTPTGIPALNEITRNRMDAIYLDADGAFKVLNGRTTSTDPAWYWVCYRRVYDMVRTDLFKSYYRKRSEPQNPDLDSDFEDSTDAYLRTKLDNRQLNGFDPTVSNDSNNSDDTRNAGQRFVDVFIEPVPPNDWTTVNLNRVARGSIRVRVA